MDWDCDDSTISFVKPSMVSRTKKEKDLLWEEKEKFNNEKIFMALQHSNTHFPLKII